MLLKKMLIVGLLGGACLIGSSTRTGTLEKKVDSTAAVSKAPENEIYIVKDGDNLWNIADKNGISFSDLKEGNKGIDYDNLKIGQKINIPYANKVITVSQDRQASKLEQIAKESRLLEPNFKVPYFPGANNHSCARYVRLAANAYGYNFVGADAWDFAEKNKLVAEIDRDLRNYKSLLTPKKSVVSFLYDRSRYKKDGRKVTHVALYVGDNKDGEMIFIENAGHVQRTIDYSQLLSKGYTPKEIIETKEK